MTELPIACFTCGKIVSRHSWLQQLRNNIQIKQVLQQQLKRACCRSKFVTYFKK